MFIIVQGKEFSLSNTAAQHVLMNPSLIGGFSTYECRETERSRTDF